MSEVPSGRPSGGSAQPDAHGGDLAGTRASDDRDKSTADQFVRPIAARPTAMRAGIAMLAGAAVAAVVIALRTSGLLSGGIAFAYAGAVLLVIPTSRELARRLFINGSLAVGWCVATWWVTVPPTSIGRISVAFAVASGTVTSWLLWTQTRQRARVLLPRGRLVDLVASAAILWVAVRLRSRLRVDDAHAALSMAMGGYDNVGHFSMINMLRLHGTTIDRLPPPGPGDGWTYDDYPQSFHSVVASVIELTHSAAYSTPSQELVRYTQGTAVVAGLMVALLVLGVASLPRLRRAPVVALPVVAPILATLLVGPGATMLLAGYHNFFFGCVAVALAMIAALLIPRPTSALHLAVLGGLLVTVANAWLPLMVLAGFGALSILWPMRHQQWRASARQWVEVTLVAAATLGGVVEALRILGRLLTVPTAVLSIGGAFETPSVNAVVLVGASSVACCLLVGRWQGSSRVIALAAVPVAGGATLALIARSQLSGTGKLGYYFSKFVYAEYIVSLLLLVVVLGVSLAALQRPRRLPTQVRHAAGSLLLALGAIQVFGWTGLQPLPSDVDIYSSMPVVDHLLGASDFMSQQRETPTAYVSMSDDAFGDPLRAWFWAAALSGTSCDSRSVVTTAISNNAAAGDPGLVRATTQLLALDPREQILVSPAQLDFVRSQIDPADADRVLTW